MISTLEESIRNRSAKVGVIGLGYVGLPLIRAFISAGFHTLGFDLDQAKIDKLLAGQSYIKHIPSEWISKCVNDGHFEPNGRYAAACRGRRFIDLRAHAALNETRDPDLTYIENTARQIAQTLRPGQLIVLESTTYPGTTREIMLPILSAGGMQVGKDFFLAFSP